MNFPAIYAKGDRTIWIVVLLLSLLSVLAVYSATGSLAYMKQDGNTEHYLFKHLVLVITGLGLMYFTHLLHYRIFSGIAKIAFLIAIPLLVITLVSGTNLNEASRWITVPIINATFQTSDFAKLAKSGII